MRAACHFDDLTPRPDLEFLMAAAKLNMRSFDSRTTRVFYFHLNFLGQNQCPIISYLI